MKMIFMGLAAVWVLSSAPCCPPENQDLAKAMLLFDQGYIPAWYYAKTGDMVKAKKAVFYLEFQWQRLQLAWNSQLAEFPERAWRFHALRRGCRKPMWLLITTTPSGQRAPWSGLRKNCANYAQAAGCPTSGSLVCAGERLVDRPDHPERSATPADGMGRGNGNGAELLPFLECRLSGAD